MKTKQLVVAVLALAALAIPGSPAATDTDSLAHEVVAGEVGARLDELATRCGKWGLSGTILVVEGDRVLLHKGYGLADRDAGIANTVATRHPSLSVTKPILATAVLRLVERGALDLDKPLSTYLGPFPEAKRQATLHHLLTHTAGLAERGSDVGRADRAAFVEAMKDAPFETPPGAQRRYSNAGYSLAAAVVEEVTGETWQRVVREEVLGPAGMSDTTFATDPAAPPVAVGYAGEVHAPRPMTLADGPPAMAELWWGAAGAAGVDGTVADLYRWLRALDDDDFLAPESRGRMFTAHIGDQGYGWHIDRTEDGAPRRWKGGGLPMYESKVAWYPDRDLRIVFAINNHHGWRVPLWSGIEAILFGRPVELPPAPIEQLSPTVLTGRYRLTGGGSIEIATADDWLTATAADGEGAAALGFEGRARREGAVLVFRLIGPGRLAGVELSTRRAAVRVVEIHFDESGEDHSTLTLTVRGGESRTATREEDGSP